MWRDVFLNNREALLEMLAASSRTRMRWAAPVRRGEAGYIEDRSGAAGRSGAT
jgi:cyclohexadieny/prephenate dehydrogenase